MIQDTAALDFIAAQIAFWAEFFSKLLGVFGNRQSAVLLGGVPLSFLVYCLVQSWLFA